MTEEPKTDLNLRIDPDKKEALKKLAKEKTNGNVSKLLRPVIDKLLEQNK